MFQLPSVGPGNVLSDMIQSGVIRVFFLKKIFRQALESEIVLNAHKVRNGEYPELTDLKDREASSEFFFLEQNDPAKMPQTVVSLCAKVLPERFGLDPVADIQVLTPMHKGDAGTIILNQVLQERLNKSAVKMDAFGGALKLGDKVMHLKNNYQKDVFNGDIGTICSVDVLKKKLYVDYEGREVEYDWAETDELSLAYAISVHKSQGSEYPAVVLPLVTRHYVLLQRNLLYTAITRGVKLVVVVGDAKSPAHRAGERQAPAEAFGPGVQNRKIRGESLIYDSFDHFGHRQLYSRSQGAERKIFESRILRRRRRQVRKEQRGYHPQASGDHRHQGEAVRRRRPSHLGHRRHGGRKGAGKHRPGKPRLHRGGAEPRGDHGRQFPDGHRAVHRRAGQAQAEDQKPLYRVLRPSLRLSRMAARHDHGGLLHQVRGRLPRFGHRRGSPLPHHRTPTTWTA